jgi:hypothetical protein
VLFGIGLVIAAGLFFELFVAGVVHLIEKYFDGATVEPWQWWYIGTCLALTVALSCITWSVRHIFRTLHVRYEIHSEEMPKPYLVVFVSRQELIKKQADVPESGPLVISVATLNRTDLLGDASLIADVLAEAKQRFWPWEMILRAIAPHLPGLRRIYLVGSKDAIGNTGPVPGTFGDCELLRRLLLPYLVADGKAATISGVGPMIVTWPEPVDFESFADVYQTLEAIRDQLSEERAEDVELCVDITGGQKPTSAAAGLFTVNNDVVIQYVQTNAPKRPQMYDVRLLEWPKKAE